MNISRRAALTAIVGTVVSACGTSSSSQLTFEDEFSGPAGSPPDPARWVHDLGNTGYGYRQLQTYTSSPANSFLDGEGHLVIRATPATDGYASARLTTLGRFSQYQGTFEARIKLAGIGAGLWPAWWLLGMGKWPARGEVDMLENYGQSFAESSVHTPDGRGFVYTKDGVVTVDSNWHVWKMTWNDGGFTFYKDGAAYLAVAPPELANWPFSSGGPMYQILNLAVGGSAGMPSAQTVFPADMLVDYVRVWK